MSLRALNTGISGIKQFQTTLDNIGNNLANVNTIGYKSSRVEFADTLNQTLKTGTPDNPAGSGTAGVQIGNGVVVSGVKNLFTQGAVTQTGVPTDLAISGEGFFVVKKEGATEFFATRAGDFRLDTSGFLVNNSGFRVQGFNTELTPAQIAAGTDYADTDTTGDIQIDIPASISATTSAGMTNLAIDSTGKINITLQDGTQFVRGQILLQKFTNPNALLKQGENLYSNVAGAGPLTINAPNTAGLKPTTNGLGRIDAGSLELSNVDIAREFANMITVQRAFQANARVVTTSDQILGEIVQLVR